jgi:hypothetical protein
MTTPDPPIPADPDKETEPLAHDPLDQPLRDLLEEWWNPPAELISTLPKGGIQLKYLGHSDTTRALTESDPRWTWAPMGTDEHGQPIVQHDDKGNPVGMWILLTVHGVTRPAFGSCDPGKRDAIKELIGDAIRNGAMRFGVAGALWSKADQPEGDKPRKPAKARKTAVSASEGTSEGTDSGRAAYDRLVKDYGKENVDGALATFSIAKFSEITPQKEGILRASLKSRAEVVEAQKMINDAFPDK